jgi:Arc/MetJ-type ribon-helix-helix transcriptional regulator
MFTEYCKSANDRSRYRVTQIPLCFELAPVDEKFIKDSDKNGIFRSEAEAVRRERERQEEKRERLLEALRAGDADITAGRVKPYTAELLNEIEQAVHQHTSWETAQSFNFSAARIS